MAEMVAYTLEGERGMLEQADTYFKMHGTNLSAVIYNVINQSDWEDLLPDTYGSAYWYDSSQLTNEEFKALRASMKNAKENPDEWTSFEDFSKKARARLNERIRSKNTNRSLD